MTNSICKVCKTDHKVGPAHHAFHPIENKPMFNETPIFNATVNISSAIKQTESLIAKFDFRQRLNRMLNLAEDGLGGNPRCPSIADTCLIIEAFLEWVEVNIDGELSNHGTYADLQTIRDGAVRVIAVAQ